MARHKLTDTKVRAAGSGWHGDGDGLWLRVQLSGSRSWVFVSIRHGRRREMGLGPYGGGARQVSLAAARVKAEEVREILGRGGDPFREMGERQARVKARTFGEIADELIEVKAPTFRNAKHLDQWRMTLAVYAKPLRKLPVAEVSTDDVAAVLRPIWATKAETAGRLRGRVEAVLDYAKALGLRDGENPARLKGHLDHILGKRPRLTRGHHAAMPWADVPAFFARLREAEGFGARALELTILCATRTGETRGATWDEIDFDKALWTIPAERMKAGKEHIVPLAPPAVEMLRGLPRMDGNPHLFPGRVKGPISDMTMTKAMGALGAEAFTVHGFRSAFRDWCGDATNFPRDVAEMALAHKVGDATEQAYRRASALAKRGKLMEAWAAYVTRPKPAGNVVAIAEARA
ncbi:MAG: integrase arm-type DNA-binding domain-containing protein [Amaricoccus sp.]|uniref:tyrosine-type recombinase/integrase n=1 Tax=Amaricoccus sp. TaxID=1872485 RepID=UPI0033154BF3